MIAETSREAWESIKDTVASKEAEVLQAFQELAVESTAFDIMEWCRVRMGVSLHDAFARYQINKNVHARICSLHHEQHKIVWTGYGISPDGNKVFAYSLPGPNAKELPPRLTASRKLAIMTAHARVLHRENLFLRRLLAAHNIPIPETPCPTSPGSQKT